MSLYKSNTSPEQDKAFEKRESTQDALARGVQVERVEANVSGKKKRRKAKGIDPQALLDAAMGTEHEEETINFLKSQGFEIE